MLIRVVLILLKPSKKKIRIKIKTLEIVTHGMIYTSVGRFTGLVKSLYCLCQNRGRNVSSWKKYSPCKTKPFTLWALKSFITRRSLTRQLHDRVQTKSQEREPWTAVSTWLSRHCNRLGTLPIALIVCFLTKNNWGGS